MIGEKLNEAYTWQAIYDLNPLYEGANLEGIVNPIVFAGDLSGEVLNDLWEMDADGVVRATYADIDRARLKYFHVYKTVDVITAYTQPLACDALHDAFYKNTVIVFQPFLAMGIPPNARLIWRKRRRQRVFSEGGIFLTLYMAGWQETIAGQNYQTLNYIYHFTKHGFDTQNDIVILSGGRKSDVELFDFELPESAFVVSPVVSNSEFRIPNRRNYAKQS